MPPANKKLGRLLLLAGMLCSLGVFFVYGIIFDYAFLGGKYDIASGIGAAVLFVPCALSAAVLLLLAKRFMPGSRWPVRILISILTIPLLWIVAYFTTTVMVPFFSRD